VIAGGTGAGISAVDDGTVGDDNLDVNVSFTNYSSIDDPEPDDADVIEGAGNQTAAPLFVDPSPTVLDFHQLAGSPTIDAGSPDTTTGTVDIDGEPRIQGTALDIGGDESGFSAPAPPPPEPAVSDTDPPDTKILKGPKKRTHKRQAKIHFGSSEPAGAAFVCSIDDGGLKPCESPERFKVGRGKHRFEVQAVDAAGNIDPTPAERKWRVKREKREKDGNDGK
jgi:hypothetical protein